MSHNQEVEWYYNPCVFDIKACALHDTAMSMNNFVEKTEVEVDLNRRQNLQRHKETTVGGETWVKQVFSGH